jgi:ferrous iron transport protein A
MGTLVNLPVGRKAKVIELQGGWGMQRHLSSLGVRPGKIVRKITSQPMGGPIMVEIEGARVAIGRGMAARIIIREIEP